MSHIVTSGYFNPLHVGHIELLKECKMLSGGGTLTVIVNNDHQVTLKGSTPFMSEIERCRVLAAIKYVDEVILSIDQDRTVCETLKLIKPDVFAKGGDSTPGNVPEQSICKTIFGVGGEKIQSSSWLLKNI